MRNTRLQSIVGLGALLWSGSQAVLPAQTPAANTVNVIERFPVQPARAAEFESALKEINVVLRKANYERYSTWWNTGAGTFEYVWVRYLPSFASLEVSSDPKLKDAMTELTALRTRMRACLTAPPSRTISRVRTDLSAVWPAPKVSPMVRGLHIRVHSGREAEMEALVKAEVLPALKKSGISVHVVMQTQVGGGANEYFSATGMSGWADLDGPLAVQKGMGEEAYNRFLAKFRTLVDSAEVQVYRYRSDLSYQPLASGSGSGN